mgnify:CR=1 FL=1
MSGAGAGARGAGAGCWAAPGVGVLLSAPDDRMRRALLPRAQQARQARRATLNNVAAAPSVSWLLYSPILAAQTLDLNAYECTVR